MPALNVTVTIAASCAALADETDLARVATRALAAEGVVEPVGVTIVVVDDATIHELNRRYLHHDEPTDILTFALADDVGFVAPGPRALGEIYLSCERAAAQCTDWGNTPEREIRFLVLHGLLHLLGWDDATPDDRQRMLDRQEALLRAYEAALATPPAQ